MKLYLNDMYTDIKLNKNLFNKSTGAVLAVSGGPDSMAMLDIFRQSDLDIKFVCATFNHGLRQESDNEVNGVKTYCSEFGIPFETEKENIKDEDFDRVQERVTYYRKNRNQYIWAMALLYLYSMGDAVVDALLSDFDNPVHFAVLPNLQSGGAMAQFTLDF